MTGDVSPVAAAAVHLLPALVWGVVGWDACRYLVLRRPRSLFFWLLPFACLSGVVHFGAHALAVLTPTELDGRARGLHAVLEAAILVSQVGTIAVLRHMVPVLPVQEVRPGAGWLAINYGSAVLVATVAVVLHASGVALPHWADGGALVGMWMTAFGTLALYELRQLARRGAWQPGSFELSSPDVVVVAVVMVGSIALMFGSFAAGGMLDVRSAPMLGLHTAMGLALAVPFLVRMLGEAIRMLLMVGATAAMTGAVLGAQAAARRLGSDEAERLVDLGILLALMAALGPGRAWLGGTVERLVFRRSRNRGAQLQGFLDTLSPEGGAVECCRQALAELGLVLRLPGAAILLADGGTVVHGELNVEPVRRVWPRGGAPAMPHGTPLEPRELPLPLREGLVDAGVVWVAAIASPRRHWGHLIASEGFVRGRLFREDMDVVAAFVGQLARVLDGAELLERAVAVERSLAHSEKLAAIGELAARIAHEIRNPVTAARSLAQQLAREPGGAFAEEHRLILAELERVERQVAALLRFARREEYRFERVALDELVRGTLASLRPRLESAGIAVGLEVAAGTTAHADREKLRQVLVNLIENAIDALAASANGRRLTIAVGAADGTATMRVADNGPGVPATSLARVFEPFFTLKPGGTGLGLAIARRTVEAHGGRIEATAAPGGGFAVTVVLPPRREAA